MDSSPDAKKYIHMENVLNQINKNYITLPPDEVQRNNKILSQVVDPLTEKIKEVCPLFSNMFERKFYGGSYYDGLKINKPEEYDLDYVLNLPLLLESEVQISDKHGYVHVQINEFLKLNKQKKEFSKFEKLEEMLIENCSYLSTTKALAWMERIINLALKTYTKYDEGYGFPVKLNDNEKIIVYGILSKAHPAFTLKLRNEKKKIKLDVDLVPCFQFTDVNWPKGKYRKNPTQKNKFLVVPKQPHDKQTSKPIEKYWRLSFQEQERELMKGNYKGMKPSLKLLKKLRDKYLHTKIASYFIKTVFLWEIETKDEKFWCQPFSIVFMAMLQKYADMIKKQEIPYYWNKKFNMIGHIKEVTLIGISNTLQNIISEIHNKLDDPFIIGKCLIQPDELEKLRVEVPFSKKMKKQNNSDLDVSFDSLNESLNGSPNNKKYSTVIFNPGLTFSIPLFSDDVGNGPVSSVSPHNSHPEKRNNVPNLDTGTETKIFNMLSSLQTKVDGMQKNLYELTRICSRLATRLDTVEERLNINSSGTRASESLLNHPDRLLDTVNFGNLRLQ